MSLPSVAQLQRRLPQRLPPQAHLAGDDFAAIQKWRGEVLEEAAQLAEKADLRAGSHKRVAAAIRQLNGEA